MMLQINDIRYSVTVHQDDHTLPFLIMLHGFMGSSRVFEPLLPGLEAFCNPITIDLLGHGETDIPDLTERFSSSCQVKDLNDIICNLHRSPLFLHGYSMGGRLALQYATLHPENLSGLILESANPGIKRAEDRAGRIKTDRQRAAVIAGDFPSFLEEWNKLPLFRNSEQVPENRIDLYREVQQGQDPEAMATCLLEFGTGKMPSAWNSLERMQLPVLLMAGETDHKYCTICHEMNNLISKARFQKIEKAGHRIHLEKPEAFLGRVKTFIKSVNSGHV